MANFPVLTLFSLALRDFRGGWRGFGIFLACIALGVAAIVGVGSTSQALSDGLAKQGRVILGGDLSFAVVHRQLDGTERAFLEKRGALSSVGLMRAMARNQAGNAALVEIKAVTADYPAVGAVSLLPVQPMALALEQKNNLWGITADPTLVARLGLSVGDTLMIGDSRFQLRATLLAEPDRLAAGIGFGPRVLMSQAALDATGLVKPGSLITWVYRLVLPTKAARPASGAKLAASIKAANTAFPQAGWQVRTRANISPEFSDNLARFTQFLTLVGLTVLLVGGVGIANAVRAYVSASRATLATFKSLGATGRTAFAIILIQVMTVALIGIAIGIGVGIALPFLIATFFGTLIPFPLQPTISMAQVGAGFAYGLLTTLSFALLPLGRAHDVPVPALFRSAIDDGAGLPRPFYLALTALSATALIGVILALANDTILAAWFMVLVVASAVVLRLVGACIMLGARKMPHLRRPQLRLAIANLHRPGALTPAMVLSLGLGLGLLVAISQIDFTIRSQLSQTIAGQTPAFFFLDIQNTDVPAFDGYLHQLAGTAKIAQVPLMRGRFVKLAGRPVESVPASNSFAWVLRGDRGITYADTLPEGTTITQGQWWPSRYSGAPLVSLDGAIAKGLGLKLGDTIVVNVLGRDVSARIANFRKINWRSMSINFVMVFSPNTFAGAPHSDLASLTFPNAASNQTEVALLRDVAQRWPGVTTIRVKDALDAIQAVVAQLAFAIRGVSAIALVSSILVLAGAASSGQQARLYDAVILKVLGMTRGRLLATYMIEFGILGLITAVFGLVFGLGAARLIIVYVMKLDFVTNWSGSLAAALVSMLIVLGLGLATTWRILGQKPAGALRELG